MKIINRLLLLLTLAVSPAFCTTVQLTGTIVDLSGTPVANGTACFKLPVNATDTSLNRALSTQAVCWPVTNGVLPTFANVTPNDVIQPANTYYRATVKNSSGTVILNANYVIPTGGGTFNLGQAIPTTVTTSNISYASPGLLNSPNTWTAANTFSALVTFNSTVAFTGSTSFAGTTTFNGPTLIGSNNVTQTIASASVALPTGAINTLTCNVTNVVSVNILATDSVSVAFNAAPTGAYLTGLVVQAPDVAAGSFNVRVCNSTAGNLTPPAATLNWRVVR